MFETGDEKLRALEQKVYVQAEIIIEAGKGPTSSTDQRGSCLIWEDRTLQSYSSQWPKPTELLTTRSINPENRIVKCAQSYRNLQQSQ